MKTNLRMSRKSGWLFAMIIGGLIFTTTAFAQKIKVKTGIEVLKESSFRILQGKRVGLITNPTGVDNNLKSTIDILHEAPNVQLVALYGPEHGVRGDVHAGDKVCGSDFIRLEFSKNHRFADIQSYWTKDEEAFRKLSKKYYLYR